MADGRTHGFSAEEFYKRNYLDNSIFRDEISLDDFITSSMGVDMSLLGTCTNAKVDAHHSHTGDFLLYLINYIKENKLYYDPKAIAALYGHIMHFFLDKTMHPYIYFQELGLTRVGLVPNHALFETYLSEYFSRLLKGVGIKDLPLNYLTKGDLKSQTITDLINSAYLKVYNVKNMIYSYRMTVHSLSAIDSVDKVGKKNRGDAFLSAICSYKNFCKVNKLDDEFKALETEMWLHPLTGDISFDTPLQLFNKAIDEASEAIKVVNEVIFDGQSIDNASLLFGNISYETGLDCNKGRKFRFVRGFKNVG